MTHVRPITCSMLSYQFQRVATLTSGEATGGLKCKIQHKSEYFNTGNLPLTIILLLGYLLIKAVHFFNSK